MLFSFVFSMLICVFAVLVYALRLFLLLYNRLRVSFLEDDMTMCCDSVKEQHAETKEELVSVLIHISHAEFIVPLLHNIRKQNYKNIELLVAVSHASVEISRSLKEELITSHREYISHIPLLVFSGRNSAEKNVHVLASAAKGEYLCVLDQRTRLSPGSIASVMKMLLLRGVSVLSVIPKLLGSSKLLRSYAAMTHIAFSIRRHLPYVSHSTSDVFSLMCAGDYYKYFLHTKGHRKYTRDTKDVHVLPDKDASHVQLRHAYDVSHAHVFSSEVTYHMFSTREYLCWFTDAFRFVSRTRGKDSKYEKNNAPESKIRFLKLFENDGGELTALFYAMLLIATHAVVLRGIFVEMQSYAIAYVIICVLSFITHYICLRSYGERLYTAVLQWLLSPIPCFHALYTLCLRVISKVVRRRTDTS